MPCMCTNTTQGEYVERLIQHDVKLSVIFTSRHTLSAVFFVHTSKGSALSRILYFLVIWIITIFSSSQTAMDISKCLTFVTHL